MSGEGPPQPQPQHLQHQPQHLPQHLQHDTHAHAHTRMCTYTHTRTRTAWAKCPPGLVQGRLKYLFTGSGVTRGEYGKVRYMINEELLGKYWYAHALALNIVLCETPKILPTDPSCTKVSTYLGAFHVFLLPHPRAPSDSSIKLARTVYHLFKYRIYHMYIGIY